MPPHFRGEPMQNHRRAIARSALVVGVLVALLSAFAASAQAADEADAIDDGRLSAPTVTNDDPPINASKNGSAEAEIPHTRESTAPPPTRAQLKDQLLGNMWPRGNFFIGAAAHWGFEVGDEVGSTRDLASSGGADLRVGNRLNRFWSFEFSGLWTSKFKSDGSEFWGWGVYGGGRFYLSKRRWQPYLGTQVGFLQLQGTNLDGRTFGFAPKFSTGLEYYLNQTLNIDLSATYYYTVGAIKGRDFVTVSLGLNWF
jgi:hypothetical protein